MFLDGICEGSACFGRDLRGDLRQNENFGDLRGDLRIEKIAGICGDLQA